MKMHGYKAAKSEIVPLFLSLPESRKGLKKMHNSSGTNLLNSYKKICMREGNQRWKGSEIQMTEKCVAQNKNSITLLPGGY